MTSRFCWTVGDIEVVGAKGYNPNQPRHPAGSPQGGEWVHGGGGVRFSDDSLTDENIVKIMGGKVTSREQAARIAGALPGASVTVRSTDDADGLEVRVEHPAYNALRRLGRDGKIVNYSIAAKETGTGLGTTVFAQQVKEAAAAGFDRISTSAERDDDMNGYYTWARLGYDADLDDVDDAYGDIADYAEENGIDRVSDFMRTPHLREWWREHGESFSGKFDLKAGSRSRKVLDAYVAAKAAGKKGFNPQQPRDPAGTPTGGQFASNSGNIISDATKPLQTRLEAARGLIVAAAQEEYDAWEQDEDGIDEVCGGGGICDIVARRMGDILAEHGIDTIDGGQDGDDHAWHIAYTATEAYGVDIPPGVYEEGGGYSWRKLPDVTITEDDVAIWKMDRGDLEIEEEDWDKGYNPQQPRHPAGTSEGGQFAAAGGSGAVLPDVIADDIRFGSEETELEIRKAFPGWTPNDFAYVAGATEGADVEIQKIGDSNRVRVRVDCEEYSCIRVISPPTDSSPGFLRNEHFGLKSEHDQGRGIGTTVFSQQVEGAVAKGLSHIETYAAGAYGSRMNGYYTWARLGFDAELADMEEDDALEYGADKGLTRVSDFMKTPELRQWWREYAGEWDARFDLEEGSQSRRVLAAYVEEKQRRRAG